MKKDASRFSPKGVLFHRTFFTAPSFCMVPAGVPALEDAKGFTLEEVS